MTISWNLLVLILGIEGTVRPHFWLITLTRFCRRFSFSWIRIHRLSVTEANVAMGSLVSLRKKWSNFICFVASKLHRQIKEESVQKSKVYTWWFSITCPDGKWDFPWPFSSRLCGPLDPWCCWYDTWSLLVWKYNSKLGKMYLRTRLTWEFVYFQRFDEIFPSSLNFNFSHQIKSLFIFSDLTSFSLNFNFS